MYKNFLQLFLLLIIVHLRNGTDISYKESDYILNKDTLTVCSDNSSLFCNPVASFNLKDVVYVEKIEQK
jgi:hypothetical protein